ncbi:proopiomelanocortin a isoform X2 [Pseudoliparis swirei]|uniref:proopiomelanocortin a isoform X2 n=1 Tax=Pseudoliparis swirei TaxID=2059687 RepID=UPI0024BDD047|nr:proopiomelanocortin a isoform X2 [Pseudoliparis swirei]
MECSPTQSDVALWTRPGKGYIKWPGQLEGPKRRGTTEICPSAEPTEPTREREREREMCPAWLLVAVALVGVARGDVSECWEHPRCQDVNSETSLMAKRSYSMEHFRWGKPVGRKRRPVKVYAADGVEEESAELFPEEMRRRELAANMIAAAAGEEEEEEAAEEEQRQRQEEEKKDGAYKMKHFRWSGPAAGKRYGGFMKSWDERRQRPLLALFKNVINKDGQQGEQ